MLHLYFFFIAEINSVLSKDFCFLGVMYLPLIGVPKQYLLVLDKRDRISKVKDLLHQMELFILNPIGSTEFGGLIIIIRTFITFYWTRKLSYTTLIPYLDSM
jgi:hypothetical protein